MEIERERQREMERERISGESVFEKFIQAVLVMCGALFVLTGGRRRAGGRVAAGHQSERCVAGAPILTGPSRGLSG